MTMRPEVVATSPGDAPLEDRRDAPRGVLDTHQHLRILSFHPGRCGSKMEFVFPIGYHAFHKSKLFNFQLNRWFSLGYARLEDMEEAGKNIKNFRDWKLVMLRSLYPL